MPPFDGANAILKKLREKIKMYNKQSTQKEF